MKIINLLKNWLKNNSRGAKLIFKKKDLKRAKNENFTDSEKKVKILLLKKKKQKNKKKVKKLKFF